MDKELKIIVLEDMKSDADIINSELRRANISAKIIHVNNQYSFQRSLQKCVPDLVLSDYNIPQFNGMGALMTVKALNHNIPVIIVTRLLNEKTAISCLKAGADDYVIKDSLSRLGPSVCKAIEKSHSLKEKEFTEKKLRESEQKYRALVESASDIIFKIDLNGYFTYANPAIVDLIGYNEKYGEKNKGKNIS